MSRTRAERREKTYSKWISKLKNLYNSKFLKMWRVKTNRPKNRFDFEQAETFDDLKEDKTSVLYKNTRTIYKDKKYDIKEDRKRKIKNRHIPKEDLDEIFE